MIASMPYRRPFLTSRDRPCIAASSAMGWQGDKPAKRKFKSYPIGYSHLDIAEVRTEEGKLYLFVAIDRTSKFAYAELHEKANRRLPQNSDRSCPLQNPHRAH
jgi:hypothetical protein